MNDKIIIKGARENNLKNIDLVLPKNKLIVMSGLSGSGKTTLAFDTIYAEGQRRYVESLSAYARQFLGGLEKADVDSIEGLSPAIAINQKSTNNNPRSTVGTITEIYDYLRLLYARVGIPYCPTHNKPIKASTIKEMIDKIYSYEEGSKVIIYAPFARQKKGTFKNEFTKLLSSGFIRVRLDGEVKLIEDINLEDKNIKHDIDIVVDRLKIKESDRGRFVDSIETALNNSDGLVLVSINDEEILFSSKYSCPECGFSIPELEPKLFSFNSPIGACEYCNGIGFTKEADLDLIVPDKSLSINEGAIKYLKNQVGGENIEWQEFVILCKYFKIDLDKPLSMFSEEEIHHILYGIEQPIKYTIITRSGNVMNRNAPIEGLKIKLERMYMETSSDYARQWYGEFLKEKECSHCHGRRLNEKALSVRVGSLNIAELCDLSIEEIKSYLDGLVLDRTQQEIARLILKEIKSRLTFLINVGLDYLTLSRMAGSLSGGEAQRIRLATQIGSNLTGILYVLDEPSIGLHQRDNARLISSLKQMRDLGNTVIVVEHDEETMEESDFIVDVGPGSGIHGGEIVVAGTPDEVKACDASITGQYLSGKMKIEVPKERRKGNGKYIEIIGACGNNLKDVNVKIPLGTFTVVSGVSGSGKSTLINDTLGSAIAQNLGSKVQPLPFKQILGLENIDKYIEVTQDPIGKTPRSNPATYTGVFDLIRDLFAQTQVARVRGYGKGRFSFNVQGGRCEKCWGDGVIKVPMNFLPDVYVPCEECGGKRYNAETLEVTYKDKNIYDVLEMTMDEALIFFENIPNIKRRIQTLVDVGLGYVKLGQSAVTLSGGEAQRLKLATELQRRGTGKTIYILDEPTTGLHSHDVNRLLKVFQRFVDNGDTIVVIEHNLDVIKSADYIIDLGPEGGNKGGTVIGQGTPEEIATIEKSYTGQYLKKVLKK